MGIQHDLRSNNVDLADKSGEFSATIDEDVRKKHGDATRNGRPNCPKLGFQQLKPSTPRTSTTRGVPLGIHTYVKNNMLYA
jgi:hypothetical protein